MNDWPDAATFAAAFQEGRAAAAQLRLCLQQRSWRGTLGNWAGSGVGSSIDFQDHRPYLPGDDPRHIDWAAYARSGNVIMKLYREEVSPRMDLLLDVSRSMLFSPAKRKQLFALAAFCVESAQAMGATLRLAAVCGSQAHLFSPETLRQPIWPAPALTADANAPQLEPLPLQPGSLRIWISDLLYPTAPAELLRPLAANHGRILLLAPFLEEEARPAWEGNLELIDCESGQRRRQRVDAGLRRRYEQAYQQHWAAWEESARRYSARLARLSCESGLLQGLQQQAFAKGVVEPWG